MSVSLLYFFFLLSCVYKASSSLTAGTKSKVRLNNGVEMPVVGIGSWKAARGEVKQAIGYAVREAGYVHIDTAWIYLNQEDVGEAIRELIDEKVVSRDQLFVTSKVWMTFFSEGDVMANVRTSLQQLGLDYVDQMLLHWPVALLKEVDEHGEVVPWPLDDQGMPKLREVDLRRTWQELEAAYKEGLARSIGVSNFEPEHIEQVTNPAHPNMAGGLCEDCEVPPAVNQVELHPSFPQRSLRRYCRERGIQIVAYSPLANPSLTGLQFQHPNPMEHPIIREIAAFHGKSAAQVLLRWSLQLGNVVIPKSVKNHRILENSQIFDFALTDEELRAIDHLSIDADHRRRMFNPDFGANGSKLYPVDRDINVSDPRFDDPSVMRTEL